MLDFLGSLDVKLSRADSYLIVRAGATFRPNLPSCLLSSFKYPHPNFVFNK